MSAPRGEGWIPISVFGQAKPFSVELGYLGRERLTAPFFEATIQQRMGRPFHQLVRPRLSLDELVERQRHLPAVPPTAFIFHMSRCGSTLLAQMLAALPRHVVLSEAPPVDAVLQLDRRDRSVTEGDRVRWLRAMVSALGQPRAGGEDRLFVKLDSWHTLYLPLIRRAFPDVPWFFLYRDPLEVLVSQARQRGSQVIPGVLPAELLGISTQALAGLSLDAYAARVLAAICEAALRHRDARGRFVSYRQLPGFVLDGLGPLRLRFSGEERALLEQAAAFNAKSPGVPFTADSGAKRAEATEALRAIAREQLAPIFARLEAARAEQDPAGG